MRRLLTLPVLVLALTLTAIAVMALLENHADAGRRAQVQVSSLELALTDLAAAPFNTALTGASAPMRARTLLEIRWDEGVLSRGLKSGSGTEAGAAAVAAGNANLAHIRTAVAAVFAITAGDLKRTRTPRNASPVLRVRGLQADLTAHAARLSAILRRIDRSDAGRAQLARVEAGVGTALAMLTLVGVFMIFYRRSLRAGRENEKLLDASRIEASTDALTGIGNRRALIESLTDAIASTEREPELLLAMFDLNGFKRFNDTFGHGAGDALLARLGARLAAVLDSVGSAYRMGGDEFCLLARCTPEGAARLLTAAVSALSESGDDWTISCSHGAVWIPSEASTATDALQVADQRMYSEKAILSWTDRPVAVVPGEPDEHGSALGQPHRDAQRSGVSTPIARRRQDRDLRAKGPATASASPDMGGVQPS